MLTSPAANAAPDSDVDDRPAYKPFRVALDRVSDLTPHLRRLTFRGESLRGFAPHGLDQRIKLILPATDGTFGAAGWDEPTAAADWYGVWRDLPDDNRPPIRTYTVRAARPELAELDIDVVLHAEGEGPASRWVSAARPGDELIVIGPDARSVNSRAGIDFHPGTAREVLLVGDETALPAISGILDALPAGMRAHALVEVPSAEDVLELRCAADHEITWLPRGGGPSPLLGALREWTQKHHAVVDHARASGPQVLEDVDVDRDLIWDAPLDGPGDFYAWLAGEASTIKLLRRMLVSELGVDRSRVAFMGYWREGRAEQN